ncbi:MAG: THUMP domain-containing protein [Thermofilaceae archaeon]
MQKTVTKLLLTTVPGIEDLLLEEVTRYLAGKTDIEMGRVLFSCTKALTTKELSFLISQLALVEKAYVILVDTLVDDLNDVKASIEGILDTLKELLYPSASFAVKAERVGEFNFTSIDLAREVGSMIQNIIFHPPVSLDDPDMLFYAEVVEGKFRFGIDLSPFVSLRDRGYRVYVHPSTLNPIVARALCRIARLRDGEFLLDPMCGGGTILIEGLLEARALGLGLDIRKNHINGAKLNARRAGVNAEFGVADIRMLSSTLRQVVDVIATNPPYGIREKAVGGLKNVYESLFNGARELLKEGGRLALLSPLKNTVINLAEKTPSLVLISCRQIALGGLKSYIFLYER